MKPLGTKKTRGAAGWGQRKPVKPSHQDCIICHPPTKAGRAAEKRQTQKEIEMFGASDHSLLTGECACDVVDECSLCVKNSAIDALKRLTGVDVAAALKYRNPKPTVDLVILLEPTNVNWLHPNVVLIKRKDPPFGWALPGGFVNEGESLENAALREGKEETGLDLKLEEQFYSYSAPDRDPRQHNISTVFLAELAHREQTPKAADDAAEIIVVDFETALTMDLAFDHKRILQDVMDYARTGMRPTP